MVSGLALLLIGYVLSTGPIAWLLQDERIPRRMEEFIQVAYRPLDRAGRNVAWFGDLMDWYRQLWTA